MEHVASISGHRCLKLWSESYVDCGISIKSTSHYPSTVVFDCHYRPRDAGWLAQLSLYVSLLSSEWVYLGFYWAQQAYSLTSGNHYGPKLQTRADPLWCLLVVHVYLFLFLLIKNVFFLFWSNKKNVFFLYKLKQTPPSTNNQVGHK